MNLNFSHHGAVATVASLLLAAACGSASQSQPQARANPTDESVVATIGDATITLADLDQKVLETNMTVMQELYNARREVLGELVADMLLLEEATTRGMTQDELVVEEITAKIAPVAEADVQAFYEQNRARLGGQTIEQVGDQIREFMQARNEQAARQTFIDGLRADADVAIALEAPRVPIVVASNERTRGSEDAEITIIEYSDFQ
jgi:hypothetical protein